MTREMTQKHGRRLTLLALVAGAGLMATACGKGAAPEAAKAVGPDVWAVVDGREIKRDDVEKAYLSAVDPTAAAGASAEEVLGVKLNVLDELITQDIMLARAKTLGIEAPESDVEAAFNQRKAGMTEEAFQTQIKQRGFTVDDVKRGLRRELSVQKVIDAEIASKITVTDQDVADYYTQNKAQFNLPEQQYRLAQIVVTGGRDPQLRNRMNDDAGTPAEASRKVSMLLERLKGGGDFGTLAMDYSEDPQSVGQGGDLGFVPASALAQVSPQLRDAVMKMQPGAVNTVTIGPNTTILALLSKEPAGQRDLTNPTVKDGIRDLLKSRKQDVLHTAYVSVARADAKVTNYLAKLVVDSQGKPPASLAPAAPAK